MTTPRIDRVLVLSGNLRLQVDTRGVLVAIDADGERFGIAAKEREIRALISFLENELALLWPADA